MSEPRSRRLNAWMLRRGWTPDGLWPVPLIFALIAAWMFWLAAVLTHPLHPTSPGALASSVTGPQTLERWAIVERTHDGLSLIPALTDPVAERYEATSTSLPADSSAGNANIMVAWKDDYGVHLTNLAAQGFPSVAVRSEPGTGSALERKGDNTVITLPESRRVHDVRHLWNGNRLLGPAWLVPALSLVLAVALLVPQPRHRTRWSWFWLLGTPLGVGFVWMLLREQIYGRRPAPARMPGGWQGFFTSVALGIAGSLLVSGVVPNL